RKRFGRESVAVAIVSAGYGLVAEDQLLVPYEATFNEMGRREALARSRHLGIARNARAAAKAFPHDNCPGSLFFINPKPAYENFTLPGVCVVGL
ncbi:MAG: hypothetical protein ACM3ZU_07220, partial [Bacteroidota bacterium]